LVHLKANLVKLYRRVAIADMIIGKIISLVAFLNELGPDEVTHTLFFLLHGLSVSGAVVAFNGQNVERDCSSGREAV
jgi:hypothetical protein